MRLTALLLPGLLALTGPAAQAADAAAGQRVHDQLCTSCHVKQYGGDGAEMYLRADRLIQSRKALERRVAFCNKMTKAGLSPDDEANISAYLNQRYYKFTE